MASNFLSAWFWDIGTGLVPIIGFYAILFAIMTIIFGWASRMPRTLPSTSLMAIGIILNAIFLGSLLVLQAAARHYYVALAVLDGISAGFYWLALFVLASSWVRAEQARWYNSWTGTLEAFLELVAPPLSGWIIASMTGLQGYRVVFAIAFVSLLGAFILILGAAKSGSIAAKLPAAPKELPKPVPIGWRALLWSFWALGMRDGIYFFLPNLLLFIISHSAIWLGIFVAAEASLEGALFWALGRWPGLNRNARSLWIATSISLMALALIGLPLTTTTLFLLGMLVSIAYPPFKISLESSALIAIRDSSRDETAMVQRTGQKEMWINSGRVLSLLVALGMVLVLPHFHIRDFRWLLGAWGFIPIVIIVAYQRVPADAEQTDQA